MSTSDVSRSLHQPLKQYSAARLEEGRPLLDADFNEGAALRDEERRAFLVDLIGATGSPDEGFSPGRPLPISGRPPTQTAVLREETSLPVQSVVLGATSQFVHAVSLRAGAIYVGGLRFALAQPEHVAMQRGFLQMQGRDLPSVSPLRSPSPDSPGNRSPWVSPRSSSPLVRRSPTSPSSPHPQNFPPFSNFYFLNAWEQEVSAIEDEELREVALGGADATTRVRRMHRVETAGHLPPHIRNCEAAWAEILRRLEADQGIFDPSSGELKSRGRLQLTFPSEQEVDCPECEISPSARYLGGENVTLRFLLTRSNRFVWGTDNGSTLYRVKVTGLSTGGGGPVTVTMLTPPRDLEHQPRRNRVIEILPFAAVLDGAESLERQDPHFQKIAAEVGAFARVDRDYDPATKSFVLEAGAGTREMSAFVVRWDSRHPAARQLNHTDPSGSDARYFFMRIWHVAESTAQIELPIEGRASLGDWGVVPVFHHAGRRGDFWTASFRIDRPDRCIPLDLLTQEGGVAPHGPRHFYAPLFFLQGEDQSVDLVSDCRRRIRRATDTSCATRSVGDGVTSFGEYSTIQSAIDALPLEGGVVEIRPGIHRGPISIRNRRNVSLVGCGQATIRSASSEPGVALLSIEDSEDVRLVELQLQAVAQPALSAQKSSSIQIRQLTFESGSFQSGEFVLGDSSANTNLIGLSESAQIDLDRLSLFPGRQGALFLDRVESVVVRGITVLMDPLSSAAPAFPLARVLDSRAVRIADGRLRAVGQIGISVEGSEEIALRNLVIESGPHQASGGGTSKTLPAIHASETERLDVLQCRITFDNTVTEHTCVSFQGSEITMEESFVEVVETPSGIDWAWGGVEIRGNTSGVVLRNNHIAGGYGHGITLGSVASSGALRGPGLEITEVVSSVPRVRGMFPSSPVARSAGSLEKVTLSGNTIERMGTNGISVPTVLGLGEDQEWFRMGTLVIERNTLRNNVRQPFAGMPTDTSLLPFSTSAYDPKDLPIQILPRGGIVLALVEGGSEIRGNEIKAHVPAAVAALGDVSIPMCGIFILLGDSLSIVDNRIVNNGEELRPTAPGYPSGLERGVRAGIAVMLAGTGTMTPSLGGSSPSPPAVRSPEDLDAILLDASALDSTQRSLVVSRNSVLQPEGRAIHVVGTGSMAVEGNSFASRGNWKGPSFNDRRMVGDVVFVLDLGRPWESERNAAGALPFGPQQPNSDSKNRFKTYLQNTISPRQFMSIGGALSFCNNQVTYDWALPPPPGGVESLVSTFATAIFSLDHVAVSANQFAMRVTGGPWRYNSPSTTPSVQETFFSDVFVLGGTIEAVQNRVSSRVGNTFLSLACCAALSSVVAYNQCTHRIMSSRVREAVSGLSRGQRLLRIEVSNQILYRKMASVDEADLRSMLEQFVKIVMKNP